MPNALTEQMEFRFRNWNIFRISLGLFFFIIFLLTMETSIPVFVFLITMTVIIASILILELYTLPYKVTINEDTLILKSRRKDYFLPISEIRRISFHFNPLYVRISIAKGTPFRLGSDIQDRENLFALLKKENEKIEIDPRLLK